MTRTEEIAQKMFKAYNAQGPNPNKTWDGKDVPPWEQLGEQVRGKWLAAAEVSQKADLPRPSVGRIVHFHFKDKNGELVTRAAIIARTWGNSPESAVQLQVFTDSANDFDEGQPGYNGLMWKTSVSPSPTGEPLENHYTWPPRA